MTDAVWYYARGDSEKGPLSTAQIKSLTTAGKIRPEDLVWKEGMETWVTAGEVQELFPNGAARPKEKPTEADDASAIRTRAASDTSVAKTVSPEPHRLLLNAARAAAGTGLAAVLLLHGCDQLALRYVGRLQAAVTIQQQEHQAQWAEQQRRLAEEMNALEKASPRTVSQQQQLKGLADKLSQTAQQRDESERLLRVTRWEPMTTEAELAEAHNEAAAYGRTWGLFVATCLLGGGLVTMCYCASDTERWMAIATLTALLLAVCTGSMFR